MGMEYYTSRGIEPYVTDKNKIGVRQETPEQTDQWSRGPSTPEQRAQIAYQRANTPETIQARQIAEQNVRNQRLRDEGIIAQSELNRQAYLRTAETPIPLKNGNTIVGVFKPPTNQRPDVPAQFVDNSGAQDKIISESAPTVSPLLLAPNLRGGERTVIGQDLTNFADAMVPKTDIIGLKGLRSGFINIPVSLGYTAIGAEYLARSAFTPRVTKNNGMGEPTRFIPSVTVKAFTDFSTALQTDPVNTVASIVGPALVMGAVGKGYTSIRARGLTDIATQDIGIGAEKGYPKVPGVPRVSEMAQSFKTRTLIPAPKEMSTGLPAEGIITKPAALPTDVPGGKYAWTGWENKPAPTELFGKTYELGKGSSELPGASAAPVAELYFTKAGGQMAEVIGFDINPIRSPSLIRWELQGIEVAPRSARTRSQIGYEPKDPRYFAQARQFMTSEKVKPGTGYIFGLKGEYELNIPAGNQFTLSKTRYRTTATTTSEKWYVRMFQTKVPILEAKTTGKIIRGGVVEDVTITMKGSYSSVKPKPLINLAYMPMGASAYRTMLSTKPYSSTLSSKGLPSGLSSKPSSVSVSSKAPRLTYPSISSSPRITSSNTPRSYSPPRTSYKPPRTSIPPTSYRPPRSYPPTSYRPPYYTPPTSTPITRAYSMPIPLSFRGGAVAGAGSKRGSWIGRNWKNPTIGLKEFFGKKKKSLWGKL